VVCRQLNCIDVVVGSWNLHFV